ncbi:MAG: ABC transporter substrate-binding protein [Thermoanaerobaculia bacterium]
MKTRGFGRRHLAAIPFLLLAIAGCGARGKDQTSVIHRRLEGEPATLNVLLITSDPDMVVLALLSRNLLDYDANLELVPGLAESVVPDESHLAYTVTLRQGVRWEDGSPVTADDVAYTIRTLMDPKTPALNRRGFFEGFERVDRVDDRTARVVFKFPSAGRLDAFNLSLLPAAKYAGTDINTNPRNRAPLANGPYRLARWDAGHSLELVRNTQYFGEKPPAERVVFRVAPDSSSSFQALLTGDLDETRLDFEQKKRLDAQAGVPARSLVNESLGYSYIGWNNRNPLFSEARVRRALTLLLDRETIAKTLYGGLARPSNGPVPPGLWSHDPSIAAWPYDPKRAEADLDAAGFKRGADGVRARAGKRFSFRLSFGSGSDLQRQVAELTQQSYRKAGIEVILAPLEWSAFSTQVDAGEFEACALAMALDPNPDLSLNWHSSQVPPNGFNSVFYVNPKADALMDRLKTTFDREDAKKLYAELARLIHEDEPVTFLHTVTIKWGVNRRIEDVSNSVYGLFLFWPGAASWRPVRVKAPI